MRMRAIIMTKYPRRPTYLCMKVRGGARHYYSSRSIMDELEVLLELQESKQIIKLGSENRKEEIRNALNSIDPGIHVVFSCTEATPANSVPYILQRYCSEWSNYLDIHNVDEIKHRDKLRAIPRPSVTGCGSADPATGSSRHGTNVS